MTAHRGRVLAAIGLALVIVAGELIGRWRLLGDSWPPLSRVWTYATSTPGRQLLGRALSTTVTEAAQGLVIGAVIAVAAAIVAVLVPPLQPGIDRLAAVVNAIPLIALAPLLITTAGSRRAPAIIAALAGGFAVFVATASGLAAADSAQRDVFTVLGSSRRVRLARLQLPAAVPLVLDGLTLGAPAAVLGAVIGEWFGAPRGVGVLLVSSMQNFQVELLWAAALSASAVSLLLYAMFALLRTRATRRFT